MGDFVRISPSCVEHVDWIDGWARSTEPLAIGDTITVDLWPQGARDFVVTGVHGRHYDIEPVIGGAK